MLVNHKLHIKKQLEKQLKLKENSSDNLVVKVNMVTFGLKLNLMNKEKDIHLNLESLVVLFLKNM